MKSLLISTACLIGGLVAATPALAVPVIGAPIVVSSTGNVTATYLGSDAGYNSQLDLVGGPTDIFDNRVTPAGTSVDLGSFTAGTVLTFRLHVVTTGDNFLSGSGSANPDGIAHAAVDVTPAGTSVGFEDTYGGGDRDYNDLLFAFTNTSNVAVPVTSAVPEPAGWAFFITGFGAVGAAMRRRQRTAVGSARTA